MTRLRLTALSIALFALLMIVRPTDAGLISISASTLSASGTEILNTGTLLAAWNVNGNAASTPTVNSIAFPNAQPAQTTLSGLTATVSDSTATSAHYTDSDLAEVMGDILGTNSGANATITISGLTMGVTYRVQMLHHHDIGNAGARAMAIKFGTSGTQTATFNAGDNQGYITTAEFVADGTSQLFTAVTIGGLNSRSILNGITVFSVPTAVPAPAALPAGLIMLGGLALRRRS